MADLPSSKLHLFCLLHAFLYTITAASLHPVVLVPGYCTNQIDARLTDSYNMSLLQCSVRKGKGWFRLYLNYTELHDPNYVPCFAEYMSSVYDSIANDYHNVPGVETRVPYFGMTQGFEYIDLDQKSNNQFLYMAKLVKHLEGIGYREGKTLFGVPYDFRYFAGPPDHPTVEGFAFFQRFKDLVERASEMNDNRPIIIMSHSFGGFQTQQLLVRNPLLWRQKYIKHFISISLGWGGTPTSMTGLIKGRDFRVSFLDPLKLKRTTWSLQISVLLLPAPTIFGDTPLVITKEKNYSAVNMVEFMKDIGFGDGVRPYKTLALPVLCDIVAPAVPVTLINGLGIKTVEAWVYSGGGLLDSTPSAVYGDGDGTIGVATMSAIKSQWSSIPGQVVKEITVANITHMGMVEDELALKQVIAEVLVVNSESF